MTIDKVSIDIDYAQRLLTGHKNLRRLNNDIVEKIVNDLNDNKFDFDNTYVCLKSDGTLFYGQHTLNAIIRYGKSVEVKVANLTQEEDDSHRIGALNRKSEYRYVRRVV